MATWVQPPNTPKADFFNAGYTDASASRAKSTDYQAGTTARLVKISVQWGSAGALWYWRTSSSATTTGDRKTESATFTSPYAYEVLEFLVPPGNYYQFEAASAVTITKWEELDL